MTRLSVNLNKVALLRNQREVGYPSVLSTAKKVLEAGAHGITVHPRPDERHIRRSDVPEIAAFLANWNQGKPESEKAEFNIEGYPDASFLDLVTTHPCDQVTLVPDAPNQKTSDHGWPVPDKADFLKEIITRLTAAGRRVSLFIDPVPGMAGAAAQCGAHRIELFTGPYAMEECSLDNYIQAAREARTCGLGINAGHDLTCANLAPFIAAIPFCSEVSIGHAITSDALDLGWGAAVKAYLEAIAAGQASAKKAA